MVNLSQDIHPLTDFKRNTRDFMNQMKKTRRPVVLTVNGKAELVVQDAEGYRQILDRLERLEALDAALEPVHLSGPSAVVGGPLQHATADSAVRAT